MSPAGRSLRLRPADRVRRKAEFDRAYTAGSRVPARYFTFIAHPAGLAWPRLGVTVSRSVGGAVVRNRVRRRLREAFRRNRAEGWPAVDMILHVRPSAARAAFADLERDLLDAVGRYAARAGRKS